ncbi:MAG: hypothetical protein WCK81_09085 [Betaproteobacteria bacterium]
MSRIAGVAVFWLEIAVNSHEVLLRLYNMSDFAAATAAAGLPWFLDNL